MTVYDDSIVDFDGEYILSSAIYNLLGYKITPVKISDKKLINNVMIEKYK